MSTEVPERHSPVNSPEGEQSDTHPLLAGFYDHCQLSELDPTTIDPEQGPALASGIHTYIAGVARAEIAGYNALPVRGRPPKVLANERRVERHLGYFYRDHGATVSTDPVHRATREQRIYEGLRTAWARSSIYPEIGLTNQLRQLLGQAGHNFAAEHAFILIAATGHSLQEIGY